MIKVGGYNFCLLDLVCDNAGKLSATKIWLHLGNIIMSKVMLDQQSVDWELMAAYGSIVAGSFVGSMFLKLKYGANNVAAADNPVPEK